MIKCSPTHSKSAHPNYDSAEWNIVQTGIYHCSVIRSDLFYLTSKNQT